MTGVSNYLLQRIYQTVVKIPVSVLDPFINTLAELSETTDAELVKAAALKALPTSEFRDTACELLEVWQSHKPRTTPGELAAAIAGAAFTNQQVREETSLELVWTGPVTGVIPLRRTEQVLLQMIREAQRELLIVSFAVYDIDEIVRELELAVARGVEVTFVAENPEESHGKINFGAANVLSEELRAKIQLLEWPNDKRLLDTSGKIGSLHAKCAVADHSTVFITSANLTHYALLLNMEMGLLVKSKALASQVIRHFEALKRLKTLV